ncbi:MAG: hypothetical protein Tsb0018_11870 [Opitutales bacterium]|tara:strand:+ start:129 stop:902 length:774 start_codon:yes stop_codon:yes gene_type:complete
MNKSKTRYEIYTFGLKSVLGLFEKRPEAIRYLVFVEELSPKLGAICSFLAKNKKAYKQLSNNELNEMAGYKEHGGVIAVAVPPSVKKPNYADFTRWQTERSPLLMLESFTSGRALGSLLQAAHSLGMKRVLLVHPKDQAHFSDEAFLSAEGAHEHLEFYEVEAASSLFKKLKDKYISIVGAPSGIGGRNLNFAKPINAPGRPFMLLINGSEAGPASRTLGQAEYVIQIPGITQGNAQLKPDILGSILLAWLQSRRKL